MALCTLTRKSLSLSIQSRANLSLIKVKPLYKQATKNTANGRKSQLRHRMKTVLFGGVMYEGDQRKLHDGWHQRH